MGRKGQGGARPWFLDWFRTDFSSLESEALLALLLLPLALTWARTDDPTVARVLVATRALPP